MPDLDVLFCYDTPKMLKVLDFVPGLVYRAGVVFVFFYIVSFVSHAAHGHGARGSLSAAVQMIFSGYSWEAISGNQRRGGGLDSHVRQVSECRENYFVDNAQAGVRKEWVSTCFCHCNSGAANPNPKDFMVEPFLMSLCCGAAGCGTYTIYFFRRRR